MSKEKPVEVLSASRYIMKIGYLYNKDDLYIQSYKVPDYLFAALMPILMLIFLLMELWFCIDAKFVLEIVSPALAFLFAAIQTIAIYSTLLWKRKLMISTINDLQNIVTRSN